MLIRSSQIITMDKGDSPFAGAVRTEGNRILEAGPNLIAKQGEEIIELEDSVLMPGLINAHCHLDYTSFKGSISPGKSFSEWIKHINALKRSFGNEDYLTSIEKGFDMLKRSGCTTVLNIEAFPELLPHLPAPPIRTWWFLELIDLRKKHASEETMLGALNFFEEHLEWLGGFGLSPHAPYTASVELFRITKQVSESLNMPFTTHIAESIEEQEMFLYGQGPMYEFLKEIGREMEDCGQGSALSHLMEFGLLTSRCLAVHMNYLQEYDWPAIERQPLNVVHCPLCHEYFGHTRFPLERLEEVGCNISLGTDSLASNYTLDMRREMQHAATSYPGRTAKSWIEMVTTHPAKALNKHGELGVLKENALADIVAFPCPEDTDPYEAVICSQGDASFVMVNGKVIHQSKTDE